MCNASGDLLFELSSEAIEVEVVTDTEDEAEAEAIEVVFVFSAFISVFDVVHTGIGGFHVAEVHEELSADDDGERRIGDVPSALREKAEFEGLEVVVEIDIVRRSEATGVIFPVQSSLFHAFCGLDSVIFDGTETVVCPDTDIDHIDDEVTESDAERGVLDDDITSVSVA